MPLRDRQLQEVRRSQRCQGGTHRAWDEPPGAVVPEPRRGELEADGSGLEGAASGVQDVLDPLGGGAVGQRDDDGVALREREDRRPVRPS